MSSADLAVQVFLKLEAEDFRILNIIEAAMSKREYVPKEQIQKYAKLPMDRVEFILSKLNKLGLTHRMQGAYVGHTLNYVGYDCLAINTLVKAGVIGSFGQTIGVGKEAEVYNALTPEGKCIAVKFHRLGRISFRQTRRKRSYVREHSTWLFQSHLAAEKEFQALQLVYKNGVSVPEPISQNRHVIAMGIIEGGELSKWRKITNPKKVFKEIMRNVKKTYLKAHVIHADLSEYNIILRPYMHILIIDWPQYVMTDHPNADELLQRDIQNVITFFDRRFKVKVEIKDVCDYVTGKSRSLMV
ncbi:MAG: serine/threonine protein kinase [Candidatus Atribacteria bacterium]|nr:serine/threonine protein kinase [Candidatus Atribacteria bacterium]